MTAMTRFAVPKDDALPGLAALLDVALIKAHLEPQGVLDCRVDHVRYKPGESCLISYAATCPEGERFWYAKCLPAGAFAEASREAAVNGRQCIALDEVRALLFAYPNNGRLAGLATLGREDRLRQLLSPHLPEGEIDTTILRYKLEARAVLRCEAGGKAVYVRAYQDERGTVVFRIMGHLFRRLGPRADLAIPEPLAFVADQRILVLGHLPGQPLRATLRTASARADLERAGQALARLHAHEDPEAPRRTIADHLARARRALRRLARFAPAQERFLTTVGDVLHARAPRDQEWVPGFVHGDFHFSQVLVDPRQIGVIDFDSAHAGPVEADLGRLLAHLRDLRLKGHLAEEHPLTEAFLQAYARAAGRSVAPERLSWWTALALLHMAVWPIRGLDADGPDRVNQLLKEVADACGL